MGPPYVANPEICKVLSSTGNYAGAGAVLGRFEAPRGHMQYGNFLKDVLGAGISGLAAILVPQGTTESPAIVKKRKNRLCNLFPGPCA